MVHDERRRSLWVSLGSGPDFDRQVRYAGGQRVEQTTAPITGMTTQDSLVFWTHNNDLSNVQAGAVDMQAYAQWLRSNYGVQIND